MTAPQFDPTARSTRRSTAASAAPASDGTAIWRQVHDALAARIRTRYEPGEFLPSENVLAEGFGVHRHTLRRAMDELVRAGVVERQRGRGTRVLEPRIRYPIHQRTRFTADLEARGRSARRDLVAKDLMPARDASHAVDVASLLEIPATTPVVRLELHGFVDGIPVGLATSWLPFDRCARVHAEFTGGSLHAFLESTIGIVPRRKSTLVAAENADEARAAALKLPPGAPLLRTLAVNADADGRPIEAVRTWFRGDAIELEIDS